MKAHRPRKHKGVPLTHCGWFFLCPIWIGDLDRDAPLIVPRRFIPGMWLDINVALFGFFVPVMKTLNVNYTPAFPILITGELHARR